MGLYEIMRMTPALRELIKPGISAPAIAAQVLKAGADESLPPAVTGLYPEFCWQAGPFNDILPPLLT